MLSYLKKTGARPRPVVKECQNLASNSQRGTFVGSPQENKALSTSTDITAVVVIWVLVTNHYRLAFRSALQASPCCGNKHGDNKLTSLIIIPPKLCPMKIIGRCFSWIPIAALTGVLCSIAMQLGLGTSSSPRCLPSARNKSRPWSSNDLLSEFVSHAVLWLKVRIRHLRPSFGKKSLSHIGAGAGAASSFEKFESFRDCVGLALHVSFGRDARPWTATMLEGC